LIYRVEIAVIIECAPNLTKAGKALGSGCRGENFAGAARALMGTEAVKRNELRTFVAPPRRQGAPLGGWKNSVVFGRTANPRYITLYT
jgi:hypothetical protein